MKSAKEFVVFGIVLSTLVVVLAMYTHTSNTGRNLFNSSVDDFSYQSNKLDDIRFQNFVGNNIQGSNIIYMAKNYKYKIKVKTWGEEFTVGYNKDDDEATLVEENGSRRTLTFEDLENSKSPYYVTPTGLFYGSIEYDADGEVDHFVFRQKGDAKDSSSSGGTVEPESEKKESHNIDSFTMVTDNASIKASFMLSNDGWDNIDWDNQTSYKNMGGIRCILKICKEKGIACDIIFESLNAEPLFFSEEDSISNAEFHSSTLNGKWRKYKETLSNLGSTATFQATVQKGTNENLVIRLKEHVDWITIRSILARYCAIETVQTTDENGAIVESQEIRKVFVRAEKLKSDLEILGDYWEGSVNYLNGLTKEDIESANNDTIFMIQMSTPKNLYKGVLKIMKPKFTTTESYTKEEITALLSDIGYLEKDPLAINEPLESYENTLSNFPNYDNSEEGATAIFNTCANGFKHVKISLRDSDLSNPVFEVNSTSDWAEQYFSSSKRYNIKFHSYIVNTGQVSRITIEAVTETE